VCCNYTIRDQKIHVRVGGRFNCTSTPPKEGATIYSRRYSVRVEVLLCIYVVIFEQYPSIKNGTFPSSKYFLTSTKEITEEKTVLHLRVRYGFIDCLTEFPAYILKVIYSANPQVGKSLSLHGETRIRFINPTLYPCTRNESFATN
jgi:hypothetical protein